MDTLTFEFKHGLPSDYKWFTVLVVFGDSRKLFYINRKKRLINAAALKYGTQKWKIF